MMKEMFTALKKINVPDAEVLDVVVAFEARHEEYRADIHDLKREMSNMKWMLGVIVGLVALAVLSPALQAIAAALIKR